MIELVDTSDSRAVRNKDNIVGKVSADPSGAWTVAIEIELASGSAPDRDALELADDCVNSWCEIFAEFGLAEP